MLVSVDLPEWPVSHARPHPEPRPERQPAPRSGPLSDNQTNPRPERKSESHSNPNPYTQPEPLTGWERVEPTVPRTPAPSSTASPAPNSTPSPAPTLAPSPAPTTAPREPELTAEQERAIARRGEPLLLAAGAGSGKTSVLVERFVRAVREDGIAPERILAITFTERAAGELRERVHGRLLALGESVAAKAASEDAYIGTFHGFCARVLRAHARAAGLAEEHEILDEGIAARLRRRAFARALGAFVADGRAEAVDLIAAYTADRARAITLGLYAELRSRGQTHPRLPTPRLDRAPATLHELDAAQAGELRALDERGAQAVALWDELLELFGARYEQAKREREGVDFDDLELRAGELFARDRALREHWAERFELLMVDELQDVNSRQLALLSALERENLFTVGDEWQSIYGFRHADVSLFRDRHAHLAPRGQSLRLAHNFRGRPELLGAVNAVFTRRFGDAYTPLRAGREGARGRVRHGRSPHLELLLADRRGRPDWRATEARLLAARLAELLGDATRPDATRPSEVAVLLRGVRDIDCYERALRERGIATVADAGTFWERQEIADLLAHLRVLADPADELALYGVLAAPPVSLPSDRLALLGIAVRAGEGSLWALAREHGGPVARAHCEWLERERKLMEGLGLAQLLERAHDHNGLAALLRAQPDGERRLANVGKLIGMASEWERAEGRDLAGFLEEAAYQQAAGGMGFLAGVEASAEPDAPEDAADERNATQRDAVRLMSVHAAKGLEFDVVCVADLGRAPSMAVPDLLVEGERVGVRLLAPDDPEPRAALDYAELSQRRREAQAEEEDRIVYVAMTRARERLVLSGAVDFASWPRERPGAAPIAWLGPALASELPALCARVRLDSLTQSPLDSPAEAGLDSPAQAGLDLPAQAGLDLPAQAGLDSPAEAGLDLPAQAETQPLHVPPARAQLDSPAKPPFEAVLSVEGTDVPLRCLLDPAGAAK